MSVALPSSRPRSRGTAIIVRRSGDTIQCISSLQWFLCPRMCTIFHEMGNECARVRVCCRYTYMHTHRCTHVLRGRALKEPPKSSPDVSYFVRLGMRTFFCETAKSIPRVCTYVHACMQSYMSMPVCVRVQMYLSNMDPLQRTVSVAQAKQSHLSFEHVPGHFEQETPSTHSCVCVSVHVISPGVF